MREKFRHYLDMDNDARRSGVLISTITPGKLSHGHNFVIVQQILMGFWVMLSIGFEKVNRKYHND